VRFSRVYHFILIGVSRVYVVYVVELLSKKQRQISTRARGEGLSHLSFSLFRRKPSKSSSLSSLRRRLIKARRRRKQSVVGVCFSPKQRHEKDPKNEKNLTTFTLTLTTTTNDNIKTVWRAWMNSKSPKAEETKGTEI
jgi:hypothetical protein